MQLPVLVQILPGSTRDADLSWGQQIIFSCISALVMVSRLMLVVLTLL